MKKQSLLYEGKTKRIFSTQHPEQVIVSYKDDIAAFMSQEKGKLAGKGAINNRVTNHLMQILEQKGIPTYYVEQLTDSETLVKKADMIDLKVVVRNVVAGSLCTRVGLQEGVKLRSPVLEYYYKNHALGDPLINQYHALAMDLCTLEELSVIDKYAFRVNEILKEFLFGLNIDLIDVKLEFGRLSDGTIILADEISPDTCRFRETRTGRRLDKDRFRHNMDEAENAYREILKRMLGE